MAVPQGSTIFNTAYFDSLAARISAAPSCQALQALVTKEFEQSIQGYSSALAAQYAAIAPIISFVNAGAPSANLADIVQWIQTFLSLFGLPYVVPYATIVAQQAALETAIGKVTAAIESAQAKFTSCTFSIPSIT